MHGMIFKELHKYVQARLGDGAWEELLVAAGLPARTYMAFDPYPDEEAVALVGAAAKRTGKDTNALLEDFGEFIAPDLIRLYRSLIPTGWSALDLIQNTETTIHRAVRLKYPEAHPPELKCARPGADQVTVTYSSPRRMCALAKGIIRGIAAHYRERLAISEPTCMLRGAPECVIEVRRTHS